MPEQVTVKTASPCPLSGVTVCDLPSLPVQTMAVRLYPARAVARMRSVRLSSSNRMTVSALTASPSQDTVARVSLKEKVTFL